MSEARQISGHHLAMLRKRMENIDALPPEWRALVHEFGWTVVAAFRHTGVSKANVARHLIETVLIGSHEIRERRYHDKTASVAGDILSTVMSEIGMGGNSTALASHLFRRGALLMERQPTRAMVAASMTALDRRPGIGILSKERKHRIRLADALEAAAAEYHSNMVDDAKAPPHA